MTIRWITPSLGTGPFASADDQDMTIIDVRDLVDKAGNDVDVVIEKIEQGVRALATGQRVLVCCDYGISRSNAIAAGILSRHLQQSFDEAVRQVQTATGEHEIKLEPLLAVRRALGWSRPDQAHQDRRPRILITGGSGFLGQALLAAVGTDVTCLAPSRAELDLTAGSTQLALLADAFGADTLVHLANPRVYTSNLALGQTLTMLRNVIEVCLAHQLRLLYLSGWEVYSGYAGTLQANEATPSLPCGPYGETKSLAESMLDLAVRQSGLRCAVLRASPVYGVGSDRPKFIYNFAQKARQNQSITTHCYLNGSPGLDLMHITDLVQAIMRALKEPDLVGNWNLGTGILTTTADVARLIAGELQSRSTLTEIPVHTHVASIAMDSRKAERELGWVPSVTLSEGLKKLL